MTNGHEFDQSAVYEIRVKGQLDVTWSDWFCGFEIRSREGETLLSGQSPDQSALYGLLAKLGEMGMMSLLVEGGSQVNGSFLDQGLVDKVLFFFSPKLIGDRRAPGIFDGNGVRSLKKAIKINELRMKKVGGDILLEGYVERGDKACSPES